MELPLQITFRNLPNSPAIEAAIREKAAWLERFHDHIIGCRVMVEAPHHHHHRGNLFHLRIDVTVPGDELVVRRAPSEHHAHEEMHVVIRDAFDAARRQLDDWLHRRRGSMKRHEERPQGQVTKLEPCEGYGFIETADGREIYFHENSILGKELAKLSPGDRVQFVEEAGERGPQASTVQVARHGRREQHRN